MVLFTQWLCFRFIKIYLTSREVTELINTFKGEAVDIFCCKRIKCCLCTMRSYVAWSIDIPSVLGLVLMASSSGSIATANNKGERRHHCRAALPSKKYEEHLAFVKTACSGLWYNSLTNSIKVLLNQIH